MTTDPPSLAGLRQEYTLHGLHESAMHADPLVQFDRWFRELLAAGVQEPNAMTLATCGRDGAPSARIVLLKGYGPEGFVFFTNYESRKGRELVESGRAALVLFRPELERQIRIEGTVERTSSEESTAYFQTRPRGSQLGAWASHQSSVVSDRETLETRMRELETQYAGQPVPRPPYWGGFRVTPLSVEFWQGRQNRLHDRLLYTKAGGGWDLKRLSP